MVETIRKIRLAARDGKGIRQITKDYNRTDKLLSLDRRILLSSFTPLPMTHY